MTRSKSSAGYLELLRAYWRANWRGDLLALLFLLGAALLFFWPVVLGRAWIPRGGGDAVSFLFPMYRFAAESFHAGIIPLWNPYQYAGSLFIADNQTGIFYPPNLLLFIFNPDFSYRAMQWLVIGHVFFAGAGMYACLRLLTARRPLPRPAAIVAGLAFMFSGVFIAHIGNLNLIAVASWLPLVFLAFHHALVANNRRAGLGFAIVGGALLGIGTLAGHGQVTFLLAAYLGLYALYRAFSDRSVWPLVLLIVLGVIAGGLAAINLLPSLEAVQYSVRAEFEAERAAGSALPWRGVLGLFAPDFYGRGEIRFWGDWPRVEYGYAGVLTLFLAGVAVAVDRSRLTRFFALSAVLFLILALGENTPLFPLITRLAPAFPFQVPARFILLADFSLAALAAIGMAKLITEPRPLPLYLAATSALALTVLTVLLWQYGQNIDQVPHHQQQMLLAIAAFILFAAGSWLLIWLRSRKRTSAAQFGAAGVLLLLIDLIALGWYIEIEPNDPMGGFAENSAALAYLQGNTVLERVELATAAWQPNLPQLEGLYSIDGVYNPLELSNYAVYIGSVGYRGSPMYNLLGTKYIVGGKGDPPGDTNFLVPVFDEDPAVTIYLNTLALPRALVLHNALAVADHDAAFDAVHADGFNPQETVILEVGQSLAQDPGTSSIEVLRYEPNYVAFEVTSDLPGYFLLSDIHHPQWQATVDGEDTPLLVADYALRAVAIEPGTHRVEMFFRPPAWTWGAAGTVATIIFLLAAAAAAGYLRRYAA